MTVPESTGIWLSVIDLKRQRHGRVNSLAKALRLAIELFEKGYPRVAVTNDNGDILHVWIAPKKGA